MLTGSHLQHFSAPVMGVFRVPSWALILAMGATAAWAAEQPDAGDVPSRTTLRGSGSAIAAEQHLKPPGALSGGNVSTMDACCTWPLTCAMLSCYPTDTFLDFYPASCWMFCDFDCCNPATALPPTPAPTPAPTPPPTPKPSLDASWCKVADWFTVMEADMDTTSRSSASANMTRHESVHLALAQIAEWFPEYSEFIAENEPFLEHVIESGEKAPADAPVTPLPGKRKKALKSLNVSGQEVEPEAIEDCIPDIAMLGYNTWNFAQLLITSTEAPKDLTPDLIKSTIKDEITDQLWTTGKSKALKQSVLGFKDAFSNLDATAAAEAIYNIFANVYTCDTLMTLANEVLYNMNFWDWLLLIGGLVANVIMTVGTGAIAFVAKAALSILSAYNVYQSAVSVVENCQEF